MFSHGFKTMRNVVGTSLFSYTVFITFRLIYFVVLVKEGKEMVMGKFEICHPISINHEEMKKKKIQTSQL